MFIKKWWMVLYWYGVELSEALAYTSTQPRLHFVPEIPFLVSPANTKHLNNIYTTSAQRLRRWSNIV